MRYMVSQALQAIRERLAQQCNELQRVHAQYLGAIDERQKLVLQDRDQRLMNESKSAEKQLRIDQIKAGDAVTTAHADACTQARLLLSPKVDNPSLRVAEYIQVGQYSINGRNAGFNEDLSMPLIVPLLGHGNIVVIGKGPSADSFIRAVIGEALEHTEANQLQLVAYDPALQNPLAPFSSLGEEEADMVQTVQTAQDFEKLTDTCRETIQRVGNLMMGGTGTLVQYRAKVGMPVEQYSLITLFDYPGTIREDTHRQLMTLIKQAPRYGISFIVRVSDPSNLPKWCSLEELRSLGTAIDLTRKQPTWNVDNEFPISLATLSPSDAQKLAADTAKRMHSLSMPVVDFGTIQPKHEWGGSTANGITFALGSAGISTTEITIGDDRAQKHNILVTGAVGQGKSNLLKVMIYSMCSRYSPDELELYLLDFKDGVTLAPMAPSDKSPAFLPQARILGLQADQSFGYAVLDSMRKEMERRSRKFKEVDVDNIAKYRKQRPNERMPRIVAFIDEFQMLLAGDEGRAAAKKLEECVRLGRAYGIHVVLASQSISGIQALATSSRGLFAQFPIRIGLKNSPSEAISTFGQNNDAAAHLRYRGQAIVNLDFGDPKSNQTVMVAKADDDRLNELQSEWYERVKDIATAPMVFDGTRAADLERDLITLKRNGQLGRGMSKCYLGRPVAIDENPVSFSIDASPGRNIAIVGSGVSPNALEDDVDNNMAIGMMEAIGLSLAAAEKPGSARFVIMDLLTDRDRQANHLGEWKEAMHRTGHDITMLTRKNAMDWIVGLDEMMAQRTDDDVPVYVLAFALERSGNLTEKIPVDPEAKYPKYYQPRERLFALLQGGPLKGIHSFLWWSNYGAFDSLMFSGLGPVSAFDGTVLLYGTNAFAKRLYGPLTKWDGEENRASFKDADNMTDPLKLIPYQPLNPQQLDHVMEVLGYGEHE